jgi:hypothetical protein
LVEFAARSGDRDEFASCQLGMGFGAEIVSKEVGGVCGWHGTGDEVSLTRKVAELT